MSKYFDDKKMFMEPQVSQYNNHMVMTNVSKETRKKYINIDTKFCDDYANNRLNAGNPSFNLANYNITLPEKINEVKSIVIRNVELPNTFYNISSSAGNHFFQITRTANGNSYMITLDDGQYDQNSLKTAINAKIDAIWDLSSVNYNIINNISQISANQQYTIQFAVSSRGDFDKYNVKSKLGWILGYRSIVYTDKKSYTSESLFNPCPTDYLFLEINDFNYSSATRLIGLFLDNFLDKNIIAKIPYKSCCCNLPSLDNCTTIFLNEENIISSVRNYFGPIHFQKIGIRLLNQFGEIVNLHHRDFSFTLEMDVLYDL